MELPNTTILALLLLPLAPAYSQQDTLIITLERVRGVLLAELQVNGQPAHFLVDTGAGISLIDEQQSDNFGFMIQHGRGQGKLHSIAGTSRFQPVAQLRLSWQGQPLQRGRLYSTDLSHIHRYQLPRRYRLLGILGADFFRQNRAVIDFNQHLLLLCGR